MPCRVVVFRLMIRNPTAGSRTVRLRIMTDWKDFFVLMLVKY